MGEKESYDAAVDARHDLAQRRQVPAAHLDAIGRYLAGVAYQTSHDAEEDHDRDGRQPVSLRRRNRFATGRADQASTR